MSSKKTLKDVIKGYESGENNQINKKIAKQR